MSKQSCVWFVEICGSTNKWTPVTEAYFHECDAKNEKAARERREKRLYAPWAAEFRVAKYVRVEPKKGRKT